MLTQTLAFIQAGVAEGLHIGAQLYVAQNGTSLVDTAIGDCRAGIPAPAGTDAGKRRDAASTLAEAPAAAMTTETLMLWQSACKPLTAVAVGLLKDRGLLAWDDPVARFVPEFAQNFKESVTLRHILTHTAGLRAVHLEWPAATWEQTIAALCENRPEPRWAAGEKAGYHPTSSWFILGEVIQRITGQMWDGFLRSQLLAPLNMVRTLPAFAPGEFSTLSATGQLGILHRTTTPAPADMLLDTQQCCTNPRPPGGIHGPARELGLFYQALLTNRTPAGGEFLHPSTHAELTTPQRVGLYDQTFRHTIDWSLGLMINSAKYSGDNYPYSFGPLASDSAYGHGGSQSSVGMADPARGLVVACIFNGCPGEAAHSLRIRTFFKTLYEELPQ